MPQQSAADWRDFANRLTQQALTEARRGVQAELDQAIAQRTATQARLDVAPSGPARSELRSQVRELDLKIEKLQEAVDKIGEKTLPRAEDRTFAGTTPPPARPPNFPTRIDPVPIIGTTLGILFVAFPLTLTISRYIWKRSTSAPAPALNQEQTRRFDRLEQSVDAIAIEVERISENQRYLTKLLAEPKKQGLGTGV